MIHGADAGTTKKFVGSRQEKMTRPIAKSCRTLVYQQTWPAAQRASGIKKTTHADKFVQEDAPKVSAGRGVQGEYPCGAVGREHDGFQNAGLLESSSSFLQMVSRSFRGGRVT